MRDNAGITDRRSRTYTAPYRTICESLYEVSTVGSQIPLSRYCVGGPHRKFHFAARVWLAWCFGWLTRAVGGGGGGGGGGGAAPPPPPPHLSSLGKLSEGKA